MDYLKNGKPSKSDIWLLAVVFYPSGQILLLASGFLLLFFIHPIKSCFWHLASYFCNEGVKVDNSKPRIVVFCCNWCSYAGADLAGVSRLQIMSNFRVIRTMCSGRIEPEFILNAFEKGADGVLITGCHPGDCHYISGNFKTLRRYYMLKLMLEQFGIDRRRLKLEWVSAGEGAKFQQVVNEFIEKIEALGSLTI